MMLGTFASEQAFHDFISQDIPRPIAWGSHKTSEDIWFYLSEFHDMIDEVPDPQ